MLSGTLGVFEYRWRPSKYVLGTHSPSNLARPVTNKAQAKLDPVRDDDTKDVKCELRRDERASGRVRCNLSGPDGYDCVEYTSAYPVDDTGTQHPICGR